VKPDAVQRGFVGNILNRIENKGLSIVGMKLVKINREMADRHYAEHIGKPFFDGLVKFITSSPVVAVAVRGENAVGVVRVLMGETDPKTASPGTVRGDLGLSIGMNLIHGSDSIESAEIELEIYFESSEIIDYQRTMDEWIIE
jgi:nucleoside-diphosphate kinase